jgi:hypothetical protein
MATTISLQNMKSAREYAFSSVYSNAMKQISCDIGKQKPDSCKFYATPEVTLISCAHFLCPPDKADMYFSFRQVATPTNIIYLFQQRKFTMFPPLWKIGRRDLLPRKRFIRRTFLPAMRFQNGRL